MPVALTPAQKRNRARRLKELSAALELGRKGPAQPIDLSRFLKEARKRYPMLAQ